MNTNKTLDGHFNTLLRNALASMLILTALIVIIDIIILIGAPAYIGLTLSPSIIFGVLWYPLIKHGIKRYIISPNPEEASAYFVFAAIALTLSFFPIDLYVFLCEDWGWLTEFGISGLGTLLIKGSIYLPALLYGFVILAVYMTIRYIKQHCQLFKSYNEKRIELHE